MKDDFKSAWTHRQRSRGRNLDSVLLKGFSLENNLHIHDWHCSVVRQGLGKISLGEMDFLVDFGCGYGRISRYVSENYRCFVVGVDFIKGYCKDATDSTDGVVCARSAEIPFNDGSISSALFITSLMYLSAESMKDAMLKLDSAMRAGGLVLLIEPGNFFHWALRLLRISSPERSLHFNGFNTKEFESINEDLGWKVLSVGGNIGFTALLPLILLFKRVRWVLSRLLRLAKWIDTPERSKWFSFLRGMAMHRWVVYSIRPGGVN